MRNKVEIDYKMFKNIRDVLSLKLFFQITFRAIKFLKLIDSQIGTLNRQQ